MKKDVLVTISGKHMMGTQSDNISIIAPAIYSKVGKIHKVEYEDPSEGIPGTTKNTISIGDGMMDIVKEGIANARMTFGNKNKKSLTCYNTPYGDIIIGIYTNNISIDESEDKVSVHVDYSLDVGGDRISNCDMNIDITSRSKDGIRLT